MTIKAVPDSKPAVLVVAATNYESDPRVIRAAEAALEANFSVDVIALRRQGQPALERVRGVRVIRVDQERYRGASHLRYLLAYLGFFVRCTITLTQLNMSRRYKVIHVNNMPDVLVFSATMAKFMGSKVILDIHDPMPETYGSKFGGLAHTAMTYILLLLERMSVAFADATITVSEPVKHHILVKHGYRPETIGVVANFADDNLFMPIPYPQVEGKIRFVFHGTILERNGLRTLIDAAVRVRHREKVLIRIIGEGDFSATVADLIRSNGVADIVEFINRVYPVREIPKILSDCHVGLVPLDIHTSSVANFALPLKLVEYTCLGLPSITVRNAAIEYYFRPDECLFFESGDVSALAGLIDKVVEKPDLLIEYRNRLEEARRRLLWSGEKDKYIHMLRDLAQQSHGGQRVTDWAP